jgi:hypothetical protein
MLVLFILSTLLTEYPVITQAGSYKRWNWFSNPADYISEAKAITFMSIPPTWYTYTTPLLDAYQRTTNNGYDEQFAHQPVIWNNRVIQGSDRNNLFVFNADTGAVIYQRLLHPAWNLTLALGVQFGVGCIDQQVSRQHLISISFMICSQTWLPNQSAQHDYD